MMATKAKTTAPKPAAKAKAKAGTATKAKPAAKAGSPKAGSKKAKLLALLGKGATVAQLTKALGWQPHTLRAAISRLDANVQRSRSEEGVTSYRSKG